MWRVLLVVLFVGLDWSLVSISVSACDTAPANIVGWWPGDGNPNDIIGTNNGTLKGGATVTNAGLVGQCFSFDGTNGYVQIPDSPSLRPTNLTVEAWVKFSSLNSSHTANAGHQYIVFKQNPLSSNFEGYGLGKDRAPNGVVTNLAGDVLYYNVTSADGTKTAEVDSTVIVTTNVWYHVAGVRGPNFLQLYVNGQLQGQVSVNFPQSYGNLPVYFGTSGESYWDGKLAGQLDEVSIYNRALSASEIAAIYNAGASGKCKGSSNIGNAPVITNPPASLAVVVSNTATFTVGVSGDAPLNYQWYFNATNAVGLNTNLLVLSNVTATNAGSYSVIITNGSGSATSTPALLAVSYPPVITNQPVGLAVVVSNNATFTVEVTGDAPLNYQWYFNVTNAVGLNSNVLVLGNVTAINAGNYSVIITNASGNATSAPAVLAVSYPPVITNEPVGVAVVVSNTATFSVGASGDAPLNYQWYFNATNAVGLNTNVLTLSDVTETNVGSYNVIITNES